MLRGHFFSTFGLFGGPQQHPQHTGAGSPCQQHPALRAVWSLGASAARPSVTSLLHVLFSRRTLAQFWCLLIHTRNWKSTANRTWSDTVASASMKFLLTCEWPVGKQLLLCCSHAGVCRNDMWKQAQRTVPCPTCSTKKHRDRKAPLEGVVYGSFYSCSSLQRGWVAFARAVFGKGVGSFLAGRTELLTQSWQDRSSLFQGYLGSVCPGCVSLLYTAPSARGKGVCLWVWCFLSYLGSYCLTTIYLVFPWLLRYHLFQLACWNKECIYLHGLACWAFPISHLEKKPLRFKVIFESIWLFSCLTERERWRELRTFSSNLGFFFRTKFWAPLGGFFCVVCGFFFL